MSRSIPNDGRALLQHSKQTQLGLITQAQVLSLPPLLQRYLRYAGVVDKEPIRTIRLTQRGSMRQQPGQKWMPLVAEQYYTTNPPAFLRVLASRHFLRSLSW